MVESTAVYTFLRGIKNKEIGYQVVNQMPPPTDMVMALKLVRMRELHHQAMYEQHKYVLAVPKSKLCCVTWQEGEVSSDSSNEDGAHQDRAIWRAFGAG